MEIVTNWWRILRLYTAMSHDWNLYIFIFSFTWINTKRISCDQIWLHTPENLKFQQLKLCTVAWQIPWTEEPGGLQSMGSWRVRHDWATSLSLFTFMHWRRRWQPTPVFSPGKSQGRGSLVGCRLWGRTESDTSEVT